MTIAVGIALCIYVLYIKFRKRNVMDPDVLFTLIIGGTFFVTSFRLSGLQEYYGVWYTLLVAFLILVFGAGCSLAKKVTVGNVGRERVYSLFTMRLMIIVLWLVVAGSFIATVVVLGPPPALSKTVRAEYFLPGWGSLMLLQYVLFALLLFDHFSQKAISNVWFWGMELSLILIGVLLSNKTQLLYTILLWFVAYNVYKKKIQIKTLVIIGIVAIIVFTVFYVFVYEQMYGVTISDIIYAYKIKLPDSLWFLAQPYMYIECNYDNLYRFISENEVYLYGYRTFGAIIEVLGLEGIVPERLIIASNTWRSLLKTKSLTTGSLFADFAQDGGIIMMVIMTFLSGWWSGYCVRRFEKAKTFLNYYLYSSVITAIFFSFFTNYFTEKVVLFNIIGAFLIEKMLRVKFVFNKVR